MVICTCMLLLWNAHAWAAYYVTGSTATVGSWSATGQIMTQVGSTSTYYKTFTNFNESNTQIKITNGTWDQSWGSGNIQSGADITLSNANGNIQINGNPNKTITVWFNQANNKVWVTGAAYATQKVYFIGENSWTDSNVKAHVFLGDAAYYAWESDQTMTKESTISRAGITYKVYSYTFPNGYKNVIFRYPSSQQTEDLTWNTSTPYYSIETSAWYATTADALAKYLAGANWTGASWSTTASKMTDNGDGSYSKDISISDASNTISLKICKYNTWTDAFGGDAAGTGHNLSVDFGKDKDGNLTFKVTHAGTTKITLTSTGVINVDAPYQVSYAAGTGATGTVSASAVTTYGSTCTLSSSTFSKTGYTQDGWSTSDGGGKSYNLGGTYTGSYEDVTLYPHWTANEYTTSNNIKESDGSTNAGTYKVTYDATSITYTTTPSKTGYNVEGLYYETSLSNKIVNNDRSLRASTSYTTSGSKWNQTSAPTMYVKWQGNTYYVSYNANGGSGTMTNSTHTYGTASNLSACTFTAPDGYTFAGWATSADGSVAYADGASVSTLATSGTYPLYAKWDELSGGTVRLNADTGGEVSKDNSNWGASATITDITSNQVVNIYARANTGYSFSTWTKTSGSGSVKTNSKSGDYNAVAYANDVVTASFTENMSTLSVSRTIDEGSPSIAVPTVTGSHTNVGYVTTRTITAAAAATGYALTSWTVTNGARTDGGGATANPITVRSNGNASESVTVAANYTIQSYTISASNSNVTYSPASGTSFKYGATGSKMTITPKSGYKITAISSNNVAITASADNNATGSWTVTGTMPAANVTLTVTTAALSTIYLQGRFRIRTASGVESYKSLGSATAENWSSEWVTSGTSQISMTYNYETGFYDLVTYRSAAELKADNNLYFYLCVGGTNTYPTSSNLTVPSSKPGSANAQTSTGNNFYFNDNGDYINVVLHYDDANKKLWYTGEAETVYSTTCYAGEHGSINAKGTAISKNASSSVNIGTNSPISATPESGYSFDKWVTTGSVTVTDPYSASTTVTASAAGGTVTATYLENSGWYLHGVIDGYTSWETSAKERPVDRPYRGISGVYYRRITNLDNNAYFGIHDGTNKYSGHESTSSDYNYTTLNTAVQLYVNSSKSFQAKDDFDNNWVVIKTTDTKKMWIQSPATYYTVTVSSDHGTVKLKEKSYGGLETVKFASGETIRVEIDTVAHYSIASVSLGATAVSMSKSGTKYVGDAVMPASDATLTVTYTPWYQVKLAASPAAAADAPTAAKTTGGATVNHNDYVISGTSVTFTKQSANGGYTWDHWENNGSGSEIGNTYVATISATTTVTAVYTPNKYTITLDNQCAYSNGTHTGGEATEFEATFGSNYFIYYMNTAPSSYNYTFGGYYSEEGGGGDQIITNLGSLVDEATVYTDADGNWNYDGEPTVYAKWSKSYTTGLSEGINANGGSGGAITLTYNSSATSGFTPSTRTGYLLAGYYTASDGGSKVINADGTIVSGDVDGYVDDGKWAYCSSTTFKIYAHWTPITYTIAFDKNDDPSFLNSDIGDDPDDIAATYAVSYTMPANTYTRTGYTFNGWATEAHKAKGSVPGTDYDYRAGSSYSNLANTQGATVTLYPKWTGNLYTVSLNARGGTCAITSMNVRYGEEYGTGYYGSLPTPLAPYGKTFVGWYTSPTGGSLVTKDTKMSTVGAHTLYARYSDIAMVYFKNTIGWEEVYVTYDAYWSDGEGGGTGNWDKIYHKMTQIYGTNVYYDQIPAAILSSWKGDIAFNSKELLTGDKHAPQDKGNYGNYNSGEVVYRMDFDSRATMFVPKDVNTNNTDGNYQKNSAQYISTGYTDGTSSNPEYTSGYWMKYNDTYSGYLFSYQKNREGDFSAEYKMNASVAGDTIFVYTLNLEANMRYDLRFRKDCQTTNTKSRQFRYGTQITSAACTDLKLVCDPNNNSWMQTTVAGEYKFILTCKKDGHMYLTVEYPLAKNDYQVLYSWNDGSAKTYASEVIKAHPDTVDTISVFVHKSGSPIASRSLKIQKCTGINGSGVPTWTDVTGGGIDLMDVTATGVYNFEITQPESGDPTGAFAGKYEGDYYIRTACSDGGWDQYKEREDNVMTYSAYSMTQTLSDPYSHYYCHYVGSTSTDITFAVATKYSPNISGTKTGDATIGNAATTLPANANVRFSWNEETNALARAYIKDAQGPSNARFMVMHGADDDMIFNPNGSAISASGSLDANELQFDDKGDWIYQVMLQAKPGAQVSIIANYNSADRYLIGGASSYETIMGGEGSNKYTIMAIYDFKTNRLMNAWTPDGDITDALSDVDMLWIRYKQRSAQQITFNGGSLENVTAVGAIQLDYDDLVGHVASWTYETRPLLRYFIAFPFDVNVSDIFGLNGAELGREFVIRKYDGAERAKNGLFLGDGDTYWIDLTMDSVMHANEGYSLVFDNEYLNGDLGSIWENKTGGSSVYLYFPAAKEIASISDANKGTVLASHTCENTKTYTYGGVQVSHTNSDSHWNLIGSPLFVDSYVYSSSGTNGQAGDKERTTLDSYYAYNVDFNYWEPELYYKAGEYYACKSMHAMLVQFAGNVTWSNSAPAAPVGVAARERHETTVTNQLITLNLLQDGEDGDHTYIKMDENGYSDFMLCEDLYKIINKSRPNIFTYAGDNCVAYNKVAIESQTINIGLEIRKNGTYTFEMPENVAGSIILIDRFDGTRTNLNIENYEIYLNRGSYYDRFAIEINVLDAPTAIDGAADGQGSLKDGKAHKFIMNDMMYIIRDGVLYDAQGKRVK